MEEMGVGGLFTQWSGTEGREVRIISRSARQSLQRCNESQEANILSVISQRATHTKNTPEKGRLVPKSLVIKEFGPNQFWKYHLHLSHQAQASELLHTRIWFQTFSRLFPHQGLPISQSKKNNLFCYKKKLNHCLSPSRSLGSEVTNTSSAESQLQATSTGGGSKQSTCLFCLLP